MTSLLIKKKLKSVYTKHRMVIDQNIDSIYFCLVIKYSSLDFCVFFATLFLKQTKSYHTDKHYLPGVQ